MLRFLAQRPWSAAEHRHWPLAFRRVVQQVLLCAHRRTARPGLWLLPPPVLQLLLGQLAERRASWMTPDQLWWSASCTQAFP